MMPFLRTRPQGVPPSVFRQRRPRRSRGPAKRTGPRHLLRRRARGARDRPAVARAHHRRHLPQPFRVAVRPAQGGWATPPSWPRATRSGSRPGWCAVTWRRSRTRWKTDGSRTPLPLIAARCSRGRRARVRALDGRRARPAGACLRAGAGAHGRRRRRGGGKPRGRSGVVAPARRARPAAPCATHAHGARMQDGVGDHHGTSAPRLRSGRRPPRRKACRSAGPGIVREGSVRMEHDRVELENAPPDMGHLFRHPRCLGGRDQGCGRCAVSGLCSRSCAWPRRAAASCCMRGRWRASPGCVAASSTRGAAAQTNQEHQQRAHLRRLRLLRWRTTPLAGQHRSERAEDRLSPLVPLRRWRKAGV